MSDDEFLRQFREAPRGDFSRKLYEQLKQEDEMIKSVVAAPALVGVQHTAERKRVKPYWLTLAAAILAMLLFGGLALFPHQSQEPMATETPALANLQPITMQNADQLQLIQEIGKGIVTDVAWSPDGNLIALAGMKGVWLQDAHDLQAEPHLLQAQTGVTIRRIAFSADGLWIAATDSNDVLVWDVESGDVIATLKGKTNRVNALAFSPDGKWLATGEGDENAPKQDNRILLWDTTTWQINREITEKAYVVMNLAFSPDGAILASEYLNRNDAVYLWDVASGNVLNTLRRTSASLDTRGMSFSPDGQTIAMADAAGNITGATLWDVESGKKRQLITLNNQHGLYSGGYVHDVAYSPDGRFLATGTDLLQIYNFQAVGFLPHFDKVSESPVPSWDFKLAYSPDGLSIASIKGGGQLEITTVQTGEKQVVNQFNAPVRTIALSPYNNRSLIYSSGDYVNKIDLETHEIQKPLDMGFYGPLDFSYDRSVMAYGYFKYTVLFDNFNYNDSGINLVDVDTGEELAHLSADESGYASGTFSPNNRYFIITSTNGLTSSAYRWDFGKSLGSYNLELFKNQPGALWNVAFNATSTYMALGGTLDKDKGEILIVDPMVSGHIAYTYDQDTPVASMIFHPDNWTLAVGTANFVNLINIRDGSTVNRFSMSDDTYLTPIAFDKDGTQLIVQDDFKLLLWDTENGEEIQLLQLDKPVDPLFNTNAYLMTAVSSDWRFIVTGGLDGVIRVWGVAG